MRNTTKSKCIPVDDPDYRTEALVLNIALWIGIYMIIGALVSLIHH